jgi:hypothetical protein
MRPSGYRALLPHLTIVKNWVFFETDGEDFFVSYHSQPYNIAEDAYVLVYLCEKFGNLIASDF